VIVASAMTAPLASSTVPLIAPVVSCDCAAPVKTQTKHTPTSSKIFEIFICNVLFLILKFTLLEYFSVYATKRYK